MLTRKSFNALAAACVMSLGFSSASAQTVANGPYYATPSWDQTLPVATRFIVLSNMGSAAVLDRETGLVWERSPDGTPHKWQAAQFICNERKVGNRMGWRLPTLQELASLVDPSAASPALPAGHPFTGVQFAFYWSATTFAANALDAWDVYFGDGRVGTFAKVTQEHVWCVRGGQGVDRQ